MLESTKQILTATLTATMNADSTATKEERNRILASINGTTERRRMLTAKQAQEILGGITRRTLFQYERRGLLHGVRLSARRVRFVADEVEKLAFEGMVQEVKA